MKSTLKLVFLFFIGLIANIETYGQVNEYLSAEQTRILAAQNVEQAIDTYITDGLSTYTLTEVQINDIMNELSSEYDSINPVTESKINETLLNAKKEYLRQDYFNQHPEVDSLFTALPYTGQYRQKACINPGFENTADLTATIGSYTFRHRRFAGTASLMQGCDTNINLLGNFIPVNPPLANAPVAIITSNVAEPFLSNPAFGITTIPNTVLNGNNSIKLNQSSAGLDITSMSKTFQIDDPLNPPTITFNFLLIMTNGHIGEDDIKQPFFSIKVFDNANPPNLVQALCFRADDPNSVFTSLGVTLNNTATGIVSHNQIRYTPNWQTLTMNLPTTGLGTSATIVFTVGDCNENGHFATVYLDDICMEDSCPATRIITQNVLPASTGELAQASNWIKASNVISQLTASPNSTIYHAQNYVELLPGFEAVFNSKFTAYPEGCSEDFDYKGFYETTIASEDQNSVKAIDTTKIKIFPNPSNKSISVSYDEQLKSITIFSMDGKTILKTNTNENISQIDVSGFVNGLYLIVVETQSGQFLQTKFLKN